MITDKPTGQVVPTPPGVARLHSGHLWLYEGHVASVKGGPAAGDLVDVLDHRNRLLGRGLFNPGSKIRVRLLTALDEPIDDQFWLKRFQRAARLRDRVVRNATAYRVIHGESDWLPGLIVDRYGPLLVLQTLSFGMDLRKQQFGEMLKELMGVDAVYERNEVKTRALEGLPLVRGFILGEGPTTVDIGEGPARFHVDVGKGQKTGWFCDQRENRLAAASLAKEVHVLDAFCHTGAFGIHAALHGAASVEGLDSSAEAIAGAVAHAELNGVPGLCRYRECDVFTELPALVRGGAQYDMVILDPPAFAKTKAAAASALAGYKQINLRALQLLRPEGVLVTCSCSHHVSEEALWAMIQAAARDARRQIRLLEVRAQAKDHPILAGMPETKYLKCFILQAF